MSRPRVFRVPPDLRVRGLVPGATQANTNAPVTVRQGVGPAVQLRGYGNNMPGPNGAPGSPVYPYDERLQWNSGSGTASGQLVQPPPAIGAPNPALSAAAQSMVSTPNGQSERDWINPTTYATVPLNQSALNSVSPILQLNYKRNSLIIQNTSTATAVGDTAPTLYINFNAAPQELGSLALPPGLGFYWSASDCPPRDAIYVLFGTFVNVGLSVVISGCVVQGTYVPNG